MKTVLKHFINSTLSLLTFGIISTVAIVSKDNQLQVIQNEANAQSIYYGSGIKEVRVCNNDNSFRMDIKASVYGDVQNIEFKSKFARTYTSLWGGVQGTSSYAWRHLGTYSKSNNNQYYHLQRMIHNYLSYEDLLFSLHVNTKSGKIIDLGGIKNIGPVEKGKCTKQY